MKKLMEFFWVVVFIIAIMLLNINGIIAAERLLRVNALLPVKIDPAVGGNDYYSSMAMLNLYDALIFSGPGGEAQPHVAESWKISEDGLIWTFNIRKGIKFHDGSELTASDVKFSFDRFRTIGLGNAYLFAGKEISTKVIDTYTVNFYLDRPVGPFLLITQYFYILNEDLIRANIKKTDEYGELGDYGKEYLLTHDAGSGPYTLKDIKVGTSMTMVVNPNYWIPIDSHAPDEFEMIGTTEPVTVRTLMSKRELELGDPYQSTENLAALEKIEGIKIARYADTAQWLISLHTKKPPTDDIHFRKAMAWAFDYDAVVNQILIGFVQAKGPIPQIISSHDPTLFQYHRNLDKAMEELKQSKYYDQLEKYPVELFWQESSPDSEKIALLFMANMNDIGITVNLVKTPQTLLVNKMADIETSPNCAIVYPGSRYAEAGSMLEQRYTSKAAGWFCAGEWLLDPEYDAMLEDAIQTIDRDERFAKYNKLQQYIVELCPTIFLCDQTSRLPFQSSYVDWYIDLDKTFSRNRGYCYVLRNIKIYPEKRAALLE